MELTFDDIKNRLRAAYIKYRRGKMPNYRGSNDLEQALDAGARNCIAAKITPEDYCTALYQAYVKDGVDNFFPNQLQGSKALEVAKRFTANYETVSPKQLWTTQIALLKTAIDRTKRPVEDILLDHVLPFSAWFRIVATVKPVQSIIDRYKDEAKSELTEELLTFLSGVAAQNVSRLRAL